MMTRIVDTGWKLWSALQDRALAVVHEGHRPESSRHEGLKRVIQVIEKPAFTTVIGWELFRRQPYSGATPPRYFATRTAWHQERDAPRFTTPVDQITAQRLEFLGRLFPTLTYHQYEISSDIAEEIMARLNALSLPVVVPRDSIGLDGVSYEVRLGNYMAGVTFLWWMECPADWAELGGIVQTLRTELDRLHEQRQAGED